MQALALYDGVIIVGILAIVALTLEWIDRRRRNRRFENGGKGEREGLS
jgi:FtsZ-interacting cell division protein ZipA